MAAKTDAIASRQEAEVNQDWEEFKSQFCEILAKCGAVVCLPFLVVIGIFYGIHAGVVAGSEKTLVLFKSLGRP